MFAKSESWIDYCYFCTIYNQSRKRMTTSVPIWNKNTPEEITLPIRLGEAQIMREADLAHNVTAKPRIGFEKLANGVMPYGRVGTVNNMFMTNLPNLREDAEFNKKLKSFMDRLQQDTPLKGFFKKVISTPDEILINLIYASDSRKYKASDLSNAHLTKLKISGDFHELWASILERIAEFIGKYWGMMLSEEGVRNYLTDKVLDPSKGSRSCLIRQTLYFGGTDKDIPSNLVGLGKHRDGNPLFKKLPNIDSVQFAQFLNEVTEMGTDSKNARWPLKYLIYVSKASASDKMKFSVSFIENERSEFGDLVQPTLRINEPRFQFMPFVSSPGKDSDSNDETTLCKVVHGIKMIYGPTLVKNVRGAYLQLDWDMNTIDYSLPGMNPNLIKDLLPKYQGKFEDYVKLVAKEIRDVTQGHETMPYSKLVNQLQLHFGGAGRSERDNDNVMVDGADFDLAIAHDSGRDTSRHRDLRRCEYPVPEWVSMLFLQSDEVARLNDFMIDRTGNEIKNVTWTTEDNQDVPIFHTDGSHALTGHLPGLVHWAHGTKATNASRNVEMVVHAIVINLAIGRMVRDHRKELVLSDSIHYDPPLYEVICYAARSYPSPVAAASIVGSYPEFLKRYLSYVMARARSYAFASRLDQARLRVEKIEIAMFLTQPSLTGRKDYEVFDKVKRWFTDDMEIAEKNAKAMYELNIKEKARRTADDTLAASQDFLDGSRPSGSRRREMNSQPTDKYMRFVEAIGGKVDKNGAPTEFASQVPLVLDVLRNDVKLKSQIVDKYFNVATLAMRNPRLDAAITAMLKEQSIPQTTILDDTLTEKWYEAYNENDNSTMSAAQRVTYERILDICDEFELDPLHIDFSWTHKHRNSLSQEQIDDVMTMLPAHPGSDNLGRGPPLTNGDYTDIINVLDRTIADAGKTAVGTEGNKHVSTGGTTQNDTVEAGRPEPLKGSDQAFLDYPIKFESLPSTPALVGILILEQLVEQMKKFLADAPDKTKLMYGQHVDQSVIDFTKLLHVAQPDGAPAYYPLFEDAIDGTKQAARNLINTATLTVHVRNQWAGHFGTRMLSYDWQGRPYDNVANFLQRDTEEMEQLLVEGGIAFAKVNVGQMELDAKFDEYMGKMVMDPFFDEIVDKMILKSAPTDMDILSFLGGVYEHILETAMQKLKNSPSPTNRITNIVNPFAGILKDMGDISAATSAHERGYFSEALRKSGRRLRKRKSENFYAGMSDGKQIDSNVKNNLANLNYFGKQPQVNRLKKLNIDPFAKRSRYEKSMNALDDVDDTGNPTEMHPVDDSRPRTFNLKTDTVRALQSRMRQGKAYTNKNGKKMSTSIVAALKQANDELKELKDDQAAAQAIVDQQGQPATPTEKATLAAAKAAVTAKTKEINELKA